MPGLPPDEVARLLEERAAKLRMELRALEAMFAETQAFGLPELFSVESRFRQRLLGAELEFVAKLAQDIRGGAFEGVGVWRRMHELRGEGLTTEEILRDPVGHLGEEARALANVPPATSR